jgi:hypothetical protein
MIGDYGNRTSKRRRLTEDTADDARAAYRAGWRIDNDGWWFRKRTKDQPAINDCKIGFDTPRKAYVRMAKYARQYDRECRNARKRAKPAKQGRD